MKFSHLLLIVCLALTGCVPMKMQVGKHIDGRVVDKATGAPIVSAQIMYNRKTSTAVLTDTNGVFVIERQVVTYWHPLLPVDHFGFYSYPLAIRAQGYKPAAYQPTMKSQPELARIELQSLR